jgi:hypothetical protein
MTNDELNVDIKDSLLVAFMQKNFDFCYILTLIPLSLHSWVSPPFSLVKSCGVLLYLGFVKPLLQVRLMSRCVSDPAA